MDSYVVSARKYRPSTFHSVVGQKSLTATLKNAISSKRIAQAYLFTGPRGVGKTSCARIFARTINCLSPTPEGEACGVCDACRDVDSGNSFNVVELDAASNNSVNDIRGITDQVNVPPQIGSYRVFIIDEVHMLSSAAFNAFLKTLEEPPKYVVFILATTEKHKVLPTILSRCQIYDFKRITIADIVEHLAYVASQENIEADPRALNVIARKADGAMRDALSIFDQVSASSGGHITYESAIANLNVLDYDYYFRLVEAFRAGDIPAALLLYKEVRDKGFDSLFFINGVASHVRDLMVAADDSTLPLLEVGEEVAQQYRKQAVSMPLQWYYAAIKLLNDCDFAYRTASSKQLLVELTLIRLCQLLNPPQPPFDRVDAGIPLHDITPSASHVSKPAPQPAPQAASPTVTQPAPQPASPSAPQAAPQPAPPAPAPTIATPAPAQPSAATPSPGVSRRRGSTRLSEMRAEAEASVQHREASRQPVTEEAFLRAWNEFQEANPDRQILLSAMRSASPKQVGPEKFSVTVDHPASRQAFEAAMTRLLDFIRPRLANDFVVLEVELNEENVVRRLPQSELLKNVVSNNPAMAQLLKNIDAELE